MNWTYDYNNDTGYGDEGFWEWWDLLHKGVVIGRVTTCEEDARRIVDLLNLSNIIPKVPTEYKR